MKWGFNPKGYYSEIYALIEQGPWTPISVPLEENPDQQPGVDGIEREVELQPYPQDEGEGEGQEEPQGQDPANVSYHEDFDDDVGDDPVPLETDERGLNNDEDE